MPADLVITDARAETMDPPGQIAEALAVSDGRISAVGTADEVEAQVGPGTRVVRLGGATVVPGFIDSHIHTMDAGYTTTLCSLYGQRGLDAYLAAIAAYADAHPDRQWIRGGGWAMPDFPAGTPHRAPLDALLPDRPVFLWNKDGHDAWVNSAALAQAGITAETPDPPRGRIERDPDGSPSGTLREMAMHLVDDLIPAPSEADWIHGLWAGQAHVNSLGITAWQDAHVRPHQLAAYRAAEASGRLHGRVVAALHWDLDRGLDQIPDLAEARRAAPGPRLRADAVKLFLDGVIESGTAYVLEPYLDLEGRPTTNRGLPNFTDAQLAATVTELDRLGFQVHMHAIGEAAIRQALDAVEVARRANGAKDTRHTIAHLECIHPDDIARFAALNVTANIQPLWAVHEAQMEHLRIPVLGSPRADWQFPFAALERAGTRLAAGSDWNVTSANPLEEIEVAVRRVDPDERANPPFLPDQRLSLDSALAAFTIGSAWLNRWEADAGRIAVGYAADLAILDRDLRAVESPSETRVVETLVAGESVYRG